MDHNQTYEILQTYPIPKDGIVYIRAARFSRLNPNELIQSNALALVPNIDIGYYKSTYTPAQLNNWIDQTQTYMQQIKDHIDQKCEEQRAKLQAIERQKQQCAALDLQRVANLPDDLIRYIHEFLLPETRIEFLLAKYPQVPQTLTKLTERNLNQYMKKNIYMYHYAPIFCYDRNHENRNRLNCIENRGVLHSFSNTCSPKQKGIEQIDKLWKAYRTAVPITPQDHHFFQSQALRLLVSMIYVSIHRSPKLCRNRRTQAQAQAQAQAQV